MSKFVGAMSMQVLAAVREAGGLSREQVHALFAPGERDRVDRTLANLRQQGYLGKQPGRGSCFVAAEPVDVARDLGEAALLLIGQSKTGLDSDQLADALGASEGDIERALAGSVADHTLVTCTVLREGERFVQYRLSAGATIGTDWQHMRHVTWAARTGAAPAPPPLPSPPPSPASGRGRQRGEVASELVEPAAPPPQPPRGIPIVGEIDIDAVHRKAAAAEGLPPPEPFCCALYSNGALRIESHGRHLTLPVEQTRRLLRYLDALRGEQVVEDALGALA